MLFAVMKFGIYMFIVILMYVHIFVVNTAMCIYLLL